MNRRHMAPLDEIAEEDSFYEQSMIASTQDILLKESRQSQIFVFSQDQPDEDDYNSSDDENVPRFNHSIVNINQY